MSGKARDILLYTVTGNPGKVVQMREILLLVIVAILVAYFPVSRLFAQDDSERQAESRPRRLANENSPYLRSHADNPVDWWSWGDDAFEQAEREDKLIFLSIGYSSCHWCHVMEEESFMDPEVADLLNRDFISILVDREKRPDIDNVYKLVSVILTGRSGWPLIIVMTPDRQPFYAATYIPKTTRFGQQGMIEILPIISRLWNEKRDELLLSADKIREVMENSNTRNSGPALDESLIELAYSGIAENFDDRYGGFGSGPKFPGPQNLLFLLRYWKRTGDAHALAMVETTLTAMHRGGIYDQIGYGFHRYTTDAAWRIPHFEKMLYDQAMLAMVYTEAFQATGKREYAETVQELFEFLIRDMRSRTGGFYSAEDADNDGEEGAFYIWTYNELREALTDLQLKTAVRMYDITSDGNVRDESTGVNSGKNILALGKPYSELAKDLGISEHQLRKRAGIIRKKLYRIREERDHPLRDEKILTDWNGLVIAALAKAGVVFDNEKLIRYARDTAEFILSSMMTNDGRLRHVYFDSTVEQPGNIDDYAFFIWGLIELYEATFETRYLEAAIALNEVFQEHFWDRESGGFFFTADDAQTVMIRQKEIYGGPYPSGNSVATYNLLRLGRMTANRVFEMRAEEVGSGFSPTIRKAPWFYPHMMSALIFALGPSYEVVIAGKGAGDTDRMLRALRRPFIPNKVVLFRPDGEESPDILRIAPFIKEQTARERATAYVCRNNRCDLPTTNIDVMLEQLGE
jgi:uncharacterized protein YyaL (SSP411 family)